MTEKLSVLPADTAGTEITRFNALKHGVLSRYTVLPWENALEYDSLVQALVAEHQPEGPTEGHLVEELAGILWRKRRLRLAEAAAHRRGLGRAVDSDGRTAKAAVAHIDDADLTEGGVGEAVRATQTDTEEDFRDMEADKAMTGRALEALGSGRNDAYEFALSVVREDTREWWHQALRKHPDKFEEDEEPYTADPDSLRRFLEVEVVPWHERRRKELEYRPLVREQAFGEALDPDKLERLARYEVHLDRKLERVLTMLFRLKDLRQGRSEL